MRKSYKLTGWACIALGITLIWGAGALAIFTGLTLFCIGIKDTKCY